MIQEIEEYFNSKKSFSKIIKDNMKLLKDKKSAKLYYEYIMETPFYPLKVESWQNFKSVYKNLEVINYKNVEKVRKKISALQYANISKKCVNEIEIDIEYILNFFNIDKQVIKVSDILKVFKRDLKANDLDYAPFLDSCLVCVLNDSIFNIYDIFNIEYVELKSKNKKDVNDYVKKLLKDLKSNENYFYYAKYISMEIKNLPVKVINGIALKEFSTMFLAFFANDTTFYKDKMIKNFYDF